MKKTLIVSIIFLFLLTSCTQQDNVKNQPKELLYVWLHDIGFEDPNFLAVINADSESENYGELVDTIPVFETVGMAHHTPIFLPSSGLIYANDFHNSHTYIYETSDPLKPKLSKSFGKIRGYSFPHSYSELPNGNIISTFQTKGGINTVGGLVEFTPEGKYLRSADAEIQEEPVFLRPYGIVLVPKLNRIITTNYDMHETDNSYHIQIWDMKTLERLHTIRLPKTENMIIDQNPFDGAFSSLSGKPTTLAGYGITDGATANSPTFTGTPVAPTASSGAQTVTVSPAIKAIVADNASVTKKASHTVNLAFHRDAFALAMRPLTSETAGDAYGNNIVSMTDPVTGLSMRLEVYRQYKQVVYELDALWGVKLIRPEYAVRIAG